MASLSTAECKQFLNQELQLASSAWKRKSKTKNDQGEIVRLFECTENNLRVAVVESDGVLFIDSQENLIGNTTNVSLTRQNKQSIPLSNSALTANAKKSFSDLKTLILDWDWRNFVRDGVIHKSNKKEIKEEDFLNKIQETFLDFELLSQEEQDSVAILQKSCPHSLVIELLNQTRNTVLEVGDLDDTYAPYHLSETFSESEIGLIQIADFLQLLQNVYTRNGMGWSKPQSQALEDTSNTLIGTCERALDCANPEQTQTLQNIIQCWNELQNNIAIVAEQSALNGQITEPKTNDNFPQKPTTYKL